MNDELFRQKSLDKVKTPDDLDEYIRVSNTGVWLLLVSIIVLLIGALVWGVFGTVDSKLSVLVQIENGDAHCIIVESEYDKVEEGMTVTFAGTESKITSIYEITEGVSKVTISNDQKLVDGIYDAQIVRKSVRPISFILN